MTIIQKDKDGWNVYDAKSFFDDNGKFVAGPFKLRRDAEKYMFGDKKILYIPIKQI